MRARNSWNVAAWSGLVNPRTTLKPWFSVRSHTFERANQIEPLISYNLLYLKHKILSLGGMWEPLQHYITIMKVSNFMKMSIFSVLPPPLLSIQQTDSGGKQRSMGGGRRLPFPACSYHRTIEKSWSVLDSQHSAPLALNLHHLSNHPWVAS